MSNAIKALANATKALKKEKQSLLAQIKLIDKALAGGSVTVSSKPKKKKAKPGYGKPPTRPGGR